MNRKHLGLSAERDLRRILLAKGYQTSRNAASHGLFDVLAFGEGVVLVIEVKSTSGQKLYLTKTSGQIEKLMLLSATCERAGPNVLAVLAVYWGQQDAFELYAVEDCLVQPVVKQGEGLDLRDIDDGKAAQLVTVLPSFVKCEGCTRMVNNAVYRDLGNGPGALCPSCLKHWNECEAREAALRYSPQDTPPPIVPLPAEELGKLQDPERED